jgi:hypothetical protein
LDIILLVILGLCPNLVEAEDTPPRVLLEWILIFLVRFPNSDSEAVILVEELAMQDFI